MLQPISGQCSYFINLYPPENTKKIKFSNVFRGHKMGTLSRNGLIKFYCASKYKEVNGTWFSSLKLKVLSDITETH